ncbi:cytochrome P450 [Achlya hypogyna]|uniref:Cytochrome P450 n=1 Tax=Achlya hypogyna TaxID=1202772 RepID=A0A1V9YZ64_ACHHY|nr:cytochrome P450 [Achlya hypogyna]
MTTYGSANPNLALPTTRLVLKHNERPRMSRTRQASIAVGLTLAMACAYAGTSRHMSGTSMLLGDAVHGCAFRDGDRISLRADTGKYFGVCNNCIPDAAYPDAAFVHADTVDPSAVWTVKLAGAGKVALQGANGKYLARCTNCAPIATHNDEAFVHVADWTEGPWAQWTCVDAGAGKVAFADDVGQYLARCNNCVNGAYPDAGFLHETHYAAKHHAQWTANRVPGN